MSGKTPLSYFLWADLFHARKKDKNRAVFDALKANALFHTLNDREIQYLLTMVYERVYERDEYIFHQGARGLGLYVIASGSVAIKTQNPQGEVLLSDLGQGSFFGELSLIEEDDIRSASAVAREKTVLIGFFKPDLMEIVQRKPEMGVKILLQLATVLGKRLLDSIGQVSAEGPYADSGDHAA